MIGEGSGVVARCRGCCAWGLVTLTAVLLDGAMLVLSCSGGVLSSHAGCRVWFMRGQLYQQRCHCVATMVSSGLEAGCTAGKQQCLSLQQAQKQAGCCLRPACMQACSAFCHESCRSSLALAALALHTASDSQNSGWQAFCNGM